MKLVKRTLWVAGALLVSAGAAYADSEVTPGGNANGPDVTIIQRGQETVQEYRSGGQLYMVKVIPAKGQPYYLVDTDGDGNLETRRNDLVSPDVVTPQWVLFRWR